jgi:hypothetical protein
MGITESCSPLNKRPAARPSDKDPPTSPGAHSSPSVAVRVDDSLITLPVTYRPPLGEHDPFRSWAIGQSASVDID